MGLGAIAVVLPGGQSYKAPAGDWRAVNPFDFANLAPSLPVIVRVGADGTWEWRATGGVGSGDGPLNLPSSAQVGFFWPGTGLSVDIPPSALFWPRVLLWGSVAAGVGLAIYLAWGRK